MADDKVTGRKTGPCIHITLHRNAAFPYTDESILIRARLTRTRYEKISGTRRRLGAAGL